MLPRTRSLRRVPYAPRPLSESDVAIDNSIALASKRRIDRYTTTPDRTGPAARKRIVIGAYLQLT